MKKIRWDDYTWTPYQKELWGSVMFVNYYRTYEDGSKVLLSLPLEFVIELQGGQ